MTARDNWAQVAHNLRALADSIDAAVEPRTEQPATAAGAGGGVPPAPPVLDTSVCPKHQTAFTPSKNPDWPAYCSQKTDDPAWGKAKNDRDGNPVLYCRITSRNAGEWLAVHGR